VKDQPSAPQPIYQQPQSASQLIGQEKQNQPIEQLQPVQANSQVDWAAKIAKVMQDQFGLKPKQQTYMYRTPYPPAYDLLPFPNRYKVSNFTKFSGQDETSTIEHINRFIIQCGEVAATDALRV
jgi:hypothetical protein